VAIPPVTSSSAMVRAIFLGAGAGEGEEREIGEAPF